MRFYVGIRIFLFLIFLPIMGSFGFYLVTSGVVYPYGEVWGIMTYAFVIFFSEMVLCSIQLIHKNVVFTTKGVTSYFLPGTYVIIMVATLVVVQRNFLGIVFEGIYHAKITLLFCMIYGLFLGMSFLDQIVTAMDE